MPDLPTATEERPVMNGKPAWRRVLWRASSALARPGAGLWLWPVLLALVSFIAAVFVATSYARSIAKETFAYILSRAENPKSRFLDVESLYIFDTSKSRGALLLPDGFEWRAATGKEIARNSVESSRPLVLIRYATAASLATDFFETALVIEDNSIGICR